MNIYQKLNDLRIRFLEQPHRKTGRNTFSNYSYFELEDFLPQVINDCKELEICPVFSVSLDGEMATLKLIDIEKPEQHITFIAPFGSCQLKGCHEVQNVGASITYMRRYCWGMALEIIENDPLDLPAVKKQEQPKEQPKEQPNEQPEKTEAELKQEAEITDVYNAMNAVLTVEELRDMTIDMTDGKDSEKRKVYWNVACKVVREKGWNVEKFSQMCIEARKGKK